jgi:translation initiation factor IF-2
MPKVRRLFKIAKELNVATSMLVDHLGQQGHTVENSPNAKIPADLYDLLLKEFASDKQLKERAEQIIERRNEERGTHTPKTETPPPPPKEEETTRDIMTAAQLRESVTGRGTSPQEPTETTPPASQPEAEKQEVSPPPVEEKVAQPEAKVEITSDEEEKKAGESPLKVIGKIDLDALNPASKRKSKAPKSKETPEKTAPKAKTPAPKKETPHQKVEEEKPVAKKQEAPVEPPVEKEAPKAEKTAPPKKEAAPEKVEAKEQPKQEAPKAKEEPAKEPETAEPQEQQVITAGENAPTLSGLKVLGKIDLSSNQKKGKGQDKNKKKEAAKPVAKTGGQPQGEGDEAGKRKRKRKRKRKKVANTGESNNAKQGGNNRGRGGKAKPSQKEIDESIKSTMASMQQGASRSRQKLRRAKRDADAERRRVDMEREMEKAKEIEVTEFITANEFANLIETPVNEIIKLSFSLGKMITINQRLDKELLEILGEEFGYEIKLVDVKDQDFEEVEEEEDPDTLKDRNSIITVMGHVDHGKTTLLDHLRKANVAEGEAGGITQHIGAYSVNVKSGEKITFLDTPGHEAFTAMRARGAQVTDIVIVVIAADDAVMPQTKEAINHAQAAEVPMIFAINKVDKPSADPEKIKAQLAEMNILVEDWGGDFQSQEISAKTGQGVDELLEKVLIQAELLELKANPDRLSIGTVIEASVEKGRGNVATMLVQKGTLKVGDPVVAGIHFGKVRALIDQNGKRVKKAGPSMPVRVLGINGQPAAGDTFKVFKEESSAKDVAQKRQELYREQTFRQDNRLTLEEITRRSQVGSFSELNVIVKGDVDGSVEALSGSLLRLSTPEVQVNIILKSIGGIKESDVTLAIASEAIILAFNTRPNAQARALAEREGVDIRTYSVIYDAINDVKDALEGLLSPDIKEEITGTAEVRETFKVSKVGTIAGCMVTQGKIFRNSPVRIIRDSVVIYDSNLSSLKRFKDDVKEVNFGYECGIMVENYNDVRVGDIIEGYTKVEVKRKL